MSSSRFARYYNRDGQDDLKLLTASHSPRYSHTMHAACRALTHPKASNSLPTLLHTDTDPTVTTYSLIHNTDHLVLLRSTFSHSGNPDSLA